MSSPIRQPYRSASSLRRYSAWERELKTAGNELEKLSGEIAWYEEQARNSARLTLQYKLEIGRRLMRAKELLPHGHFLSWARTQFGWTPRHIQNHVLLAENAKRVSHLPVGASLRLALASIRKLAPEAVATSATSDSFEAPVPVQRIHIVGEILEGGLDHEQFLAEVEQLASRLGAVKSKWKARWAAPRDE
jgi:hypothetical protein